MNKKTIERTPYTLSAEVFSVIVKKPSNIEEITYSIFRNVKYNNQCRVWGCVNAMMKHGILVPIFRNGIIFYKYNTGYENKDVKEG